MTPIAKNVIVIDEQGNRYEATYLKRAKGLVKNGRARFIDENTICLACPPRNLEDNKMTENINTVNTSEHTVENSVDYILKQIAELQATLSDVMNSAATISSNMADALKKLADIDNGDIDINDAISKINEPLVLREATYQKMIGLYEKMLDRLMPNENDKRSRLDGIQAIAKHYDFDCSDELTAFVKSVYDMIYG